MLHLIISMLVSLAMNPFTWNTHNYPKNAEQKFMAICTMKGGTKEQCQCNVTKGEAAWTIKQAYNQGLYFIYNGKLTDEAWKLHASCLPE
jgi:hypothetical protein